MLRHLGATIAAAPLVGFAAAGPAPVLDAVHTPTATASVGVDGNPVADCGDLSAVELLLFEECHVDGTPKR
ncbi:hypothetical protein [Streptomyces sp. NPDC056883]|uniref:hypothetical protein n=1 Tax=Streptomyces sp. NPDC056883 TaxID=3345959 RepID=UPI0036CDF9EB